MDKPCVCKTAATGLTIIVVGLVACESSSREPLVVEDPEREVLSTTDEAVIESKTANDVAGTIAAVAIQHVYDGFAKVQPSAVNVPVWVDPTFPVRGGPDGEHDAAMIQHVAHRLDVQFGRRDAVDCPTATTQDCRLTSGGIVFRVMEPIVEDSTSRVSVEVTHEVSDAAFQGTYSDFQEVLLELTGGVWNVVGIGKRGAYWRR